MIINQKQLKTKALQQTGLAFLLGIILLSLISVFRPPFSYHWTIAVEVICGALLAVALALCINEDTRTRGILYVSFMLLAPVIAVIGSLFFGSLVSFGVLFISYGMGLAIGFIYDFLVLRKAYFELLDFAVSKLAEVLILVIALIFIIFSFGPQVLSFVFSVIDGIGTSTLLSLFRDYFINPELLIDDLLLPFIVPIVLLSVLPLLLRKLKILKSKISSSWILCMFALALVYLVYNPYIIFISELSADFAAVVIAGICIAVACGGVQAYRRLKNINGTVKRFPVLVTLLFVCVEILLIAIAAYTFPSLVEVFSNIVYYPAYYTKYLIIPGFMFWFGLFLFIKSIGNIIGEIEETWGNFTVRFNQNKNVFVIGPPNSGKTTFAFGLLKFIYEDTVEKIVPNENRTSAVDLQDELEHFYQTGDMPDSTKYYHFLPNWDFTLYKSLGFISKIVKKLFVSTGGNRVRIGFIPVNWTIIDYPGESYGVFGPHDVKESELEPSDREMSAYNYNEYILLHSEDEEDEVSRNKSTVKMTASDAYELYLKKVACHLKLCKEDDEISSEVRQDLVKRSLSLSLLDEIRSDSGTDFQRYLTNVIIYTHFQHAGKLIFLIDGDHLVDDKKTYKKDMEFYRKVLEPLTVNNQISKKVAFVVTKSDMLFHRYKSSITNLQSHQNLSQYDDSSRKGLEMYLGDKLFSEQKTKSFRATLESQGIPVYLTAISLDGETTRDIPGHAVGQDPNDRSYELTLVGFDEIVKFGK